MSRSQSQASPPQGGDASAEYCSDADPSLGARGNGFVVRSCSWCRSLLPPTARRDSLFCGQRCRQAAFRLRRRMETEAADATPKRVAYADPPYPGFARALYKSEEVDHRELIARLVGFDGWALSTSSDALRDVLPMCPAGVRVCAWVKPNGVPQTTFGLHSRWEPLIVSPARRLRPGRRDWLSAQPARGGGNLIGRKPLAFCSWMFEAVGMLPGDELRDLFPGTGIVGRAWAYLSASSTADGSA